MICDFIINDLHTSEEQRQRELEYKNYVETHIQNVQQAWANMQNIPTIIDFACAEGGIMHSMLIPLMDLYIAQHDASKYGADEWEPYRIAWFPVDEQEKKNCKQSYEAALIHHYMNNTHHPEFWDSRKNDMDIPAVLEFCCDLIGMSMAKGGTALEYFNKAFDKNKLGEQQREWAEFIFKEYYKKSV